MSTRIPVLVALLIVGASQAAPAQRDDTDAAVAEAVTYLRIKRIPNLFIDARFGNMRRGTDTIPGNELAKRLGLQLVMPDRRCAGSRAYYAGPETYLTAPRKVEISGDAATMFLSWSRNVQDTDGPQLLFIGSRIHLKKQEGRWIVVKEEGPWNLHSDSERCELQK
jgi:hypothetical protein